jgi:hypothetical protein
VTHTHGTPDCPRHGLVGRGVRAAVQAANSKLSDRRIISYPAEIYSVCTVRFTCASEFKIFVSSARKSMACIAGVHAPRAVCVQVCCVIQGDGYMDACVRHTVLVPCTSTSTSTSTSMHDGVDDRACAHTACTSRNRLPLGSDRPRILQFHSMHAGPGEVVVNVYSNSIQSILH